MLTLELNALLQIDFGRCLICLSLRALRLVACRTGVEKLVFRRNGPQRPIATKYYRRTLWLGKNLGGNNRRGNFNACGRSVVSLAKTRARWGEQHRGA